MKFNIKVVDPVDTEESLDLEVSLDKDSGSFYVRAKGYTIFMITKSGACAVLDSGLDGAGLKKVPESSI